MSVDCSEAVGSEEVVFHETELSGKNGFLMRGGLGGEGWEGKGDIDLQRSHQKYKKVLAPSISDQRTRDTTARRRKAANHVGR
jgi:hypothetical protein